MKVLKVCEVHEVLTVTLVRMVPKANLVLLVCVVFEVQAVPQVTLVLKVPTVFQV